MPSRDLFGVSHLSTFGAQMCSSGAVLAPSTMLAVVGTICLANPPNRGDHTSRNRVRQKLSRSGTRQDRWEGTDIHGPKEVRRSVCHQTVLVGVNTAENEVATWLSLDMIAIPLFDFDFDFETPTLVGAQRLACSEPDS